MDVLERRHSKRLERRGSAAPYSALERKSSGRAVAGGGAKAAVALAKRERQEREQASAAGSGVAAALALKPGCGGKPTSGGKASSGLTGYMGTLGWDEPAASSAAAKPPASSKYPQTDVVQLKAYFDQFDKDRSGSISLGELKQGLLQQKVSIQRVDGLEHKLDERNRAASYMTSRHNGHRRTSTTAAFLDALAESLFAALDRNRDGHASFRELLVLMYPRATPPELDTMCGWVAPKAATVAPRSLSAAQQAEVRTIFGMYDTDRSGALSVGELQHALRSAGLEADEVVALHAQFDLDGDGRVDLREFTELMLSSGLYDDDDGSLADRVAIAKVASDGARAARAGARAQGGKPTTKGGQEQPRQDGAGGGRSAPPRKRS